MNLSSRRVTGLCNEGYFDGAFKHGKSWRIPNKEYYIADSGLSYTCVRLPLTIGVSSYKEVVNDYYYVDKTKLIKDIIDEKAKVSLFTRPRRFGKTLNMDMLKCFFEISDEDTSKCFVDKDIWSYGKNYKDYQGKYPVIFVSFKDIKYDSYEKAICAIKEAFKRETLRHLYLLDYCGEYNKKSFEKMITGNFNEYELSNVLYDLSSMLYSYHNKQVIIIIDEYDTPINEGYICGYYDQIILFMRNFFSAGLKDNKYLAFGFLTGILRVSKESIFSGLNNLKVNSILDNKYSSYFGFTKNEVKDMALYYGLDSAYHDICEWYDGYLFGDSEIFNPWSIINYFNNEGIFRPYWQATGSNEIIGDVAKECDIECKDKLMSLLNGKTINTYVDTGVIYPEIKNNPASIFSFLLVAGYLKINKQNIDINGDLICEVSIPNKEIANIYRREILNKVDDIISSKNIVLIQEAIFQKDVEAFKECLKKLLANSVSYFDTVHENFYHGFLLGICALFNGVYVSSNIETGEGRQDIELRPKKKDMPGVIIEIKRCKNNSELSKCSKLALKQIVNKKYASRMVSDGVNRIIEYGIAFCGKEVGIEVKDSMYISTNL